MGDWISVDDRLPEDGDVVLEFGTWCGEIDGKCEFPVIEVCSIYNGMYECSGDYYSCWLEDVTHWMPLPNPPEVES